MALVKEGDTKEIEVHDGTITINSALSVGTILGLVDGRSLKDLQNPTPALVRGLLQHAIVAWSYDDPVTPENIERLDLQAAVKVFEEVSGALWGDQKKAIASSVLSQMEDGQTS